MLPDRLSLGKYRSHIELCRDFEMKIMTDDATTVTFINTRNNKSMYISAYLHTSSKSPIWSSQSYKAWGSITHPKTHTKITTAQ